MAQMAAVDIGEDSKADARASPKEAKKDKKAPKPGYAYDYSALAQELNVCTHCCEWWMSYPEGYYIMLDMNIRRVAEFPNSISMCWDCGSRL